MAAPVLVLKRGDTSPAFEAQCLNGASPVDLTGATARLLRRASGRPVISTPLALENAPQGRVRRVWETNDLDAAGTYLLEVEVTFSDGKVQTFPANGQPTLLVTDDLR